MKRLAYSVLVLGLLQTTVAQAQSPSFSYTNLGFVYGSTDFDNLADDFRTMAISGSFELSDRVFLHGQYSTFDKNDVFGADFDSSLTYLGAGFVMPMGSGMDLFASLDYVITEAEGCTSSVCRKEDDNGISVGFGTNYWAIPNQLDVTFDLNYVTFDKSDDATAYGIGMGYWFTKEHRVGMAYRKADSSDSMLVNYRYSM